MLASYTAIAKFQYSGATCLLILDRCIHKCTQNDACFGAVIHRVENIGYLRQPVVAIVRESASNSCRSLYGDKLMTPHDTLFAGCVPLKSRKWPICLGVFGAAAFTVPAAFTPGTSLAIAYICRAMFLRKSRRRRPFGSSESRRAAAADGVAGQHAELWWVSRWFTRAMGHWHGR